MSEEKDLEGIGGWLWLVAIGVVIGPFRILLLLITTYPPMFSDGTWELLTSPDSEAYNSLWAPILFGEIAGNMALVVVTTYMAVLFFMKKADFPLWYIGVAVFTPIFILLDSVAVSSALPGEPVFDPETVKQLSRGIFSACIWIPYMLSSKRVKQTFVE